MPSIDIAANTRAAQASIKDLSKTLDDTADALDDVARDGGKSADRLEASFREMTRASEKAGRDIAQDQKAAAAKVERAWDDVGDDGATAFLKVKDGAQEVQQEIGQNLGEAVSSIRNDITELGQVGQDTLGGLAATLAGTGPAGLVGAAALAGAALGLGFLTGEWEKRGEEADALRDRIAGIFSGAAEEGRKYLDTAAFISEANDLMFNPERADEWKRLRDDARKLGLDEAEIIKANTGDLQAQEEVQRRIVALIGELGDRQKGLAGTAEYDMQVKPLREMQERWQQINDVTRDNAEKTRILNQVSDDLHRQERDRIKRTADASREQYEAQARYFENNPLKWRIEIDDSAVRRYTPPRLQGTVDYRPNERPWE